MKQPKKLTRNQKEELSKLITKDENVKEKDISKYSLVSVTDNEYILNLRNTNTNIAIKRKSRR